LLLLAPLIVAAYVTGQSLPECRAASPAPALDHAIIVVNNLDAASDRFRDLGFRIKPGRLHANGLLNRHIKFRDGTEVELMTVRGTPRDDMARDYSRLMRAGDGGVYVALRVPELSAATRHASALGSGVRASSSGPWSFVSFPDTSPLAAVFFTTGGGGAIDPDSIIAHRPAVTRLEEAWIEGGATLIELLRRLGARDCGLAKGPGGISGRRVGLRHGSVVVVAATGGGRPRVLGVVLGTQSAPRPTVRPVPQFWIDYRRATGGS
jgi:hypothetical protein